MIITDEFSVPASAYARRASRLISSRALWIVLSAAAICLAASFHDLRWALVALIFLLIVMPAVIANAYLSRLISPEASMLLLRKRMEITPGRQIDIIFLSDSEDGREEGCTIRCETIGWNRIRRIVLSRPYLRFDLTESKAGFLLMPIEAVTDSDLRALLAADPENATNRSETDT